MTAADAAFADCWHFVCAVYGRPGVGRACLSLQVDADADIPLLLFMAWLAADRGVRLAPHDRDDATALVQPWRDSVIRPLRTLRTSLKASPLMSRGNVAIFRERIKAQELEAERIEIAMLVDWALARWPQAEPFLASNVATNVMLGIRHVADMEGHHTPAGNAALIIRACQELSDLKMRQS